MLFSVACDPSELSVSLFFLSSTLMMGKTLVPKCWFSILTRRQVMAHKEDSFNIMNHGERLKFNISVSLSEVFVAAHNGRLHAQSQRSFLGA
jgi:hypothetical protein